MQTKRISRKEFLQRGGLLGLVSIFSLSKLGNLGKVQAAVLDNTNQEDVSEDVIYIENTADEIREPFRSGQKVNKLATVVNSLNAKFLSAFDSLKSAAITQAAFRINSNEINEDTRYQDVIDNLSTIEDKGQTIFIQSSVEEQTIPAGFYEEGSKVEVDRVSLLSEDNLRDAGTLDVFDNGEYSTLKEEGSAFSKFKVSIDKNSEGVGKSIYNNGYDDGVAATKKGTATAGDVLSGKTFTNSSGVAIAGTLAKQEKTITVGNTTTSQTITPDAGKLLSKVVVKPELTYSVSNGALYIKTN